MIYNIKKIFDEKFCTMQRASNKIEKKKKKKIYMISRLIIYCQLFENMILQIIKIRLPETKKFLLI
jgi:hypothetical protein